MGRMDLMVHGSLEVPAHDCPAKVDGAVAVANGRVIATLVIGYHFSTKAR